jgi:hypothetical protein
MLLVLLVSCQAESQWTLFATRTPKTEGSLPNTRHFEIYSQPLNSEEECRKAAPEFLWYQNHGEDRPQFLYQSTFCAQDCKISNAASNKLNAEHSRSQKPISLGEYNCKTVITL